MRDRFEHTPYYCEENVWHLCIDPRLNAKERAVLVISNRSRTCLFWHQRAAPKDAPVFWDYHVVLLANAGHIDSVPNVFDLDSTLDFPISATDYLGETFAGFESAPDALRPSFRWIGGERFHKEFASDRRHMRTEEGQWIAPPPSWAPPNAELQPNLQRLLDMDDPFFGPWLSLAQLRQRLGETEPMAEKKVL